MSNLCSRIVSKPPKRLQDSMSVAQTNAWMNGKRGVEKYYRFLINFTFYVITGVVHEINK